MAVRLLLMCAGGTASARQGAFPASDEPLDAGGHAKVQALRLALGRSDRWQTSPAVAASETAALLGVAAVPEPALRDIDRGQWASRPFDTIDPVALAAWLRAPEAATPGGEAMADVAARVAPWLDHVRSGDERVVAITHAAVMRAALAHALALPIAATHAIDVAPLTSILLSFHDRWRLQELRRA